MDILLVICQTRSELYSILFVGHLTDNYVVPENINGQIWCCTSREMKYVLQLKDKFEGLNKHSMTHFSVQTKTRYLKCLRLIGVSTSLLALVVCI